MKVIFINKDNLKEEEIDEEVVRVKGLLINSNNEILLGYSHNCYQFPGGHKEDKETLSEVLQREIKEETGIELEIENKAFLCIKYYTKNYFNSGKNRCNKIYYIEVETDEKPDLTKTNYTKEELEGNYELRYHKLTEVKQVLLDNCDKHSISKTIANEMIMALDCYFGKERD